METIIIPCESEMKQWIKEAIKEYFEERDPYDHGIKDDGEHLLSRKEIADFLDISLVTLHDWMKRGLPSHKQRGRVYFIRSEVMDHIKLKRLEM